MSDVALLEQVQRGGRRARRLLWLRASLMAISAGLLWAQRWARKSRLPMLIYALG